MKMEEVGNTLQWIFTSILYPILIIGIFLYIIISISIIIHHSSNSGSHTRRLMGALLPVILLIFITITEEENRMVITKTVYLFNNLYRFLIGAIIGIALLEFGRIFAHSDNDIGASIYAMFLSAFGVFILYSIMQGVLSSMHYLLFGIILAGGLDIIFRGAPNI